MSAFIHAMGAAVTGVTVVTTTTAARPIGRTVSAMCSVSAEPPLLLVAIRTDSPLVAAIDARGAFAVNVLSDRQADLSESFAGRVLRPHVFRPRDWWPLTGGAPPLLHGAAARFALRRRQRHARRHPHARPRRRHPRRARRRAPPSPTPGAATSRP